MSTQDDKRDGDSAKRAADRQADAGADKRAGVRVSAGKCVRCGQPVNPRTRPFCSQRCADLDLGSWLSERYRVPTEEQPLEGEAGDGDPAPDDGRKGRGEEG